MASMKDTYRSIFGEDLVSEPYKMVNHSFHFNKRIGKSVCSNCGLVNLRNDLTEWSIRMGCMSSDHSQYKNTIKRFSTFN